MNRFHALTETTFDVIVVGGGIIGAGIARDAAMRGFKVALLEKADFGSGTTAGSTRLIHGGLRYLEMLDFGLVRTDLREREILLRIVPHLVKPLRFLLPFYGQSPIYRLKMKLGMVLYDLLSYYKSLPRHSILTASQVGSAEPELKKDGLKGGATYYDAQVELPERLCLENILDARQAGAHTLNYAEVVGALCSRRTLQGVLVRDHLTASDVEVRGRLVVNASGPWFDRVRGTLTGHSQPMARTTKGIHLACRRVSDDALVLFSKIDGRLFFVIPWLGYSWIGTTDTDFPDDPRDARASGAEVLYLLDSAREFLPSLDSSDVYFTNSGVRALIARDGQESSVTRMHQVLSSRETGLQGLISVLGGKITGYRGIAEEVTNLICAELGRDAPCRTALVPLPGARGETGPLTSAFDPDLVRHLQSLYGNRAGEVLQLAESTPGLRSPLTPGYPDIAGQVVFAVRSEQCLRLSDFFLRRTRLGFTPDQGRRAIEPVAHCMAKELSWSHGQTAREMALYLEEINRTQQFRPELKNESRIS